MALNNEFNKIAITDDFMFATVLKQNKGACKRLLESILGFEISKLEYVNNQETISSYKNSHGIRLDVIAKDTGTIYDIEMQKANDDDIMKRSRYYQSQIDTSQFLRGMDYRKLKNTYIIFICMFDLFGLDQYIYRFENYDKDLGLSSGDGAKKIIINATGHKGNISDDLKAFINYINSPKCDENIFANDFIKQLDDAVWKNSNNEKWRLLHMKYEADAMYLIGKGIKKGEAIGIENERYRIRRIFELARDGKSVDYIAADISMPREYVEETLNLAMMK